MSSLFCIRPAYTTTTALGAAPVMQPRSHQGWLSRLFCGAEVTYQAGPTLSGSTGGTSGAGRPHGGTHDDGDGPSRAPHGHATTVQRDTVLVMSDSAWELLVGKAKRITIVRTVG